MTIKQRIFALKNILKKLSAENILLVAVSKAQPTEAIEEAFAAGISNFGENYWQEAKSKIEHLDNPAINWHFIGHVQSNKAKQIANAFLWVHTVDSKAIAKLLAKYRSPELPFLNICIQVNLDNEPNKSGISPKELENLVPYVLALPRLKLRGLMAVPKKESTKEKQYQSFLRLKVLLESINQKYNTQLDSLSMGMTDDFEAAIFAGATILRIGRAIFGERTSSKN